MKRVFVFCNEIGEICRTLGCRERKASLRKATSGYYEQAVEWTCLCDNAPCVVAAGDLIEHYDWNKTSLLGVRFVLEELSEKSQGALQCVLV